LLNINTCAIIHLMHINRFNLLENLNYSALTTMFVQLEFDQGHDDSHRYFYSLLERGKLSSIPLEIDDLIEMANVPESKHASDAELSCFVVARRLGCRTITDDGNAIKFAKRHLGMDLKDILQLVDLIFEAYEVYVLGDYDLRSIQATLAFNKFTLKFDLATEAARRHLMASAGI
jgi:hypothetical protein